MEPRNPTPGNFRFQGKRVFLTYKTHIDKGGLLAFIQTKVGGIDSVSGYCIFHERGKNIGDAAKAEEKEIDPQLVRSDPRDSSETEEKKVQELGSDGYDHTHALFEFTRKFSTRDARFFDFDGIHPHVKPVLTTLHLRRILDEYSVKEDEDPLRGGFSDRSLAERIWNESTLQDALRKFAEKSSDFSGIINAWNHRPQLSHSDSSVDIVEWRAWQDDLLRRISTSTADDRKIIWYVDTVGGYGKTYLARHLVRTRLTFYTQSTSQRDVACGLKRFIDSRGTVEVCIFDLTRSQEGHIAYSTLEMVKNGIFFNSKYDSGMVEIPNNVWCIVFANFQPDRDKLSADRWEIISLLQCSNGLFT